MNVTKVAGRVNGLSSAADTVADLELRGSYANSAPVQVVGKLNPLAAKSFLDIKADVKGVDLVAFSPYSGKYAGYNIDTQATHATNDLSLGTVADIDSIFDEIDITNLATGFRSLMGATQGVGGLTVTKGGVYAWGWVGGDTTGHLTAYLVIEPRKSAVS